MLETTKEQRIAGLADHSWAPFGRALCRDVNALVEALEGLIAADDALEEGTVGALPILIVEAKAKARAVLAESTTPEQPRWHEGFRKAPPAAWADGMLVCWRYMSEGDVCVLERGHDGGIHEPADTGSG